MGFAKRVGDRLQAQMAAAVRATPEAAAAPGQPSAALVLADRQHVVDSWIDERYPQLGRLAPASPVSGDAVARGVRAGDRADLGGRAVPRRRRSLGR